jgi:hypothetical protein
MRSKNESPCSKTSGCGLEERPKKVAGQSNEPTNEFYQQRIFGRCGEGGSSRPTSHQNSAKAVKPRSRASLVEELA